jgi:hypothetical protein
MTELPTSSPSPIHGAGRGSAPIAPASGAKKPADGEGALAFKALLERLDGHTRALAQESRKDLTQDQLAGAVEQARASLEQMLSLQDQVLEAWRAAQQAKKR